MEVIRQEDRNVNMPTVRDRNVRKLRRMRKKAKARMKNAIKDISTSKEER